MNAPKPHSIWSPKGDAPDPSNHIVVSEVRVSFSPRGGGFACTVPLSSFLARHRPLTPQEAHSPDLRLAYFAFDDDPAFLAWTTGQRWNGWGKPLVEVDTLRRWMQACDCELPFEITDNVLCFFSDDSEKEDAFIFPEPLTWQDREHLVFDVGRLGLCWNQYDLDELDSLPSDLLADIAAATTPAGVAPDLLNPA